MRIYQFAVLMLVSQFLNLSLFTLLEQAPVYQTILQVKTGNAAESI
jgi:hypothetical protein